MDFLFLPPIYLLSLLFSGIVIGILSDYLSQKRFVLAAGSLFGLFTVSQLVFRILENAMPERLVGQLIYFMLFLLVVYLAGLFKDRFLTRGRLA